MQILKRMESLQREIQQQREQIQPNDDNAKSSRSDSKSKLSSKHEDGLKYLMNISDDLQKVINKAKSSEEFKKKQKDA